LPSNLRPITRECVHLVTRAHFRSRDKDGVTPFDPSWPKTSCIHASIMALSVLEPELWAIDVLHCGNGDYRLFCSRYLGLTNLTRIHWRYTGCANMNFLRQGPRLKAFESYRLTYIYTYTKKDRQIARQTDTTEVIYHAALRVHGRTVYA